MYEVTFSLENSKDYLAHYIVKQLNDELSSIDGIVTEVSSASRIYVSGACSDTYRFQVKRLCEHIAVDVLSAGYKNIFLHNMLSAGYNDFFVNSLINAVSIIDIDYDKQFISKIIDVDKPLYLDGYFNFRIGELVASWKEISRLIGDNNLIGCSCDVVIDFIKYLYEAVPERLGIVSLSLDNNYVIYSERGKVLKPFETLSKLSSPEEEAIVNLICLKPHKLRLYDSGNFSKDFLQMVMGLFEVEVVPAL